MPTPLAEELATCAAHRAEILGRAKGQFVHIKKDRVVEVFADRTDAIDRGYKEFGNQPFLVKEVVEVEEPFYFSTFQLPA